MPRYRALMARPFRFAVQVRTLDDPSAIIAAARTAELLGYDDSRLRAVTGEPARAPS